MKNYKDSKDAGKSTLEVKDNVVYVVQKSYDTITGAELDDIETPCPSVDNLDFEINKVQETINKLEKEKESLNLLKADYIELKGD